MAFFTLHLMKIETEFNDDTLALKYIKDKGYASYSSMKNVRDCAVPMKWSADYFDTGIAVHSLLLEHRLEDKIRAKLTEMMLWEVKMMLASLARNPVVCKLLEGSKNEDKFPADGAPPVLINRLPVLGYIDINGRQAVGDLKTTRYTKKSQFIQAMDFLQASLYRRVTGKDDFIYVGISKVSFEVFTFNVNEFPTRIMQADQELERLTKYIAKKLCL